MGEESPDVSKPVIIGTIGIDLFIDNVWALDFVSDRFALTPYRDDLPDGIGYQGETIPITLPHRKLFLPLNIDGQTNEDFFYDSGSSASGLFTSAATWRKLTGRTGDEEENVRKATSSWGTEIVTTGAPTKARIEIAGITFDDNALITSCFDPPPALDLEQVPFRVAGVIGNMPFLGKGILMIDIRRSQASFLTVDKR